jgi:phenylacetate-CoA ligase
MFRALNMRLFLWRGGDKDAPAANITDRLSLDPALARIAAAGGTRPRLAAFDTGPTHYLDIRTPVAEQLDWLLGVNPATLTTFPTNLRALVRESARRGRRPGALRDVSTLSEQLDPDLRAEAQAAWGVRLFDVYSAVECGMLAFQCPLPGHEHYLVQAENALLEVLDDDGRPCLPGTVGRVVATVLHNFATPLIRYELGDYAEVGAPCPAAPGLPVLTRILGRARNMLVLPSGGEIWPLFNRVLNARDFPELRQFQIVQRTVELFELRLAVSRPLGADGEARLEACLRQAIGPHVRAAFVYVDEIARGPGGKYEDFRSLVGHA